MYMLDGTSSADQTLNYKLFHLLGKEFTFTVDVSKLPCGMNGALYFVEMPADGGVAHGEQGPAWGTGYCDAQCPSDQKTVDGQMNDGCNKSDGGGKSSCCQEMDIWEANIAANSFTAHPCAINETWLVGNQVGYDIQDTCDSSGCDFNPYRLGAEDAYGNWSGTQVDTNYPFEVTTQFLSDGNGTLTEIRRIYMQNGIVIGEPQITFADYISDDSNYSSITDDYCAAENTAFGGDADFAKMGGLTNMGQALARGMVLVMSIWNDTETYMQWLDGTEGTGPGSVRGPCGEDNSVFGDSIQVIFSNITYGDIGSTVTSTR